MLLLSSCASQGRYDEAVRSAESTRADNRRLEACFDTKAREDQHRIDVLTDLASHDKVLRGLDDQLSRCAAQAEELKGLILPE